MIYRGEDLPRGRERAFSLLPRWLSGAFAWGWRILCSSVSRLMKWGLACLPCFSNKVGVKIAKVLSLLDSSVPSACVLMSTLSVGFFLWVHPFLALFGVLGTYKCLLQQMALDPLMPNNADCLKVCFAWHPNSYSGFLLGNICLVRFPVFSMSTFFFCQWYIFKL